MDMSKYVALYCDECRSRLRQIRQLLLSISPTQAQIDELFRHLHTIKGMSATMGYEAIASLAHRLESQIVEVRDGNQPFTRDLRHNLQDGIEQIQYDLSAMENGKPPVPALRVRSDVLDELLDNLGELFIVSQRIKNGLQNNDLELLDEQSQILSKNLARLNERITTMRLTPLSFLTDRLAEILRDLGKKLGKEVKLDVSGEDLEIDRAVLEALDTPLTQILRNAVDHGIESASERQAAGKEAAGTIALELKRVERHLQVIVSDDGRGLDSQALVQKALEKQLISQDKAATLSERDKLFLCCLPGLSTCQQVSDISGRGVGMDLVKAQLEAIGGRLDINSQKGKGTTIILELPLSLAMVQALLVQVNGQQLAVPMWQLSGTMIIEEQANFRGEKVQLFSLAQALFPKTAGDIPLFSPALVVEDHHQLFALAVDKILRVTELIIKPISSILSPLECYSGTSLLGNGQPVLILDLYKIIQK